jgi:hypothetical protein
MNALHLQENEYHKYVSSPPDTKVSFNALCYFIILLLVMELLATFRKLINFHDNSQSQCFEVIPSKVHCSEILKIEIQSLFSCFRKIRLCVNIKHEVKTEVSLDTNS